jgi:hypothetical protein
MTSDTSTKELDEAIKQWALPELLKAVICLNMPMAWTDDGDPVYDEKDCQTLSTGFTAANLRIKELETQLAALNNIASNYGMTSGELIQQIANYEALLVWPGDKQIQLLSIHRENPENAAASIINRTSSDFRQELVRLLLEEGNE